MPVHAKINTNAQITLVFNAAWFVSKLHQETNDIQALTGLYLWGIPHFGGLLEIGMKPSQTFLWTRHQRNILNRPCVALT